MQVYCYDTLHYSTGLAIKISVKTLSRDSRVGIFVSLSVTRLHRLKVEKMHFHTNRQYYFPIFSVLVQSLQKMARRVPRYRCRVPVTKKTACSNVHRFQNLAAKLSKY